MFLIRARVPARHPVFIWGLQAMKNPPLTSLNCSSSRQKTHTRGEKKTKKKPTLLTYLGFGCVWLAPIRGARPHHHPLCPFFWHNVMGTRGDLGTRVALGGPRAGAGAGLATSTPVGLPLASSSRVNQLPTDVTNMSRHEKYVVWMFISTSTAGIHKRL